MLGTPSLHTFSERVDVRPAKISRFRGALYDPILKACNHAPLRLSDFAIVYYESRLIDS